MRKIIVSNFVSLDGFIAGPRGEIDWFVWNDETAAVSKELLGSIDTILFGRVTYELMADFWPTATTEDPVITAAMNNLAKIVFSWTLPTVSWQNAQLASTNLADAIMALKRRPGKDMAIFGSGSIVAKLTQLRLIDEYRLFVNPVLLGSGKVQFSVLEKQLDLTLLESRTFATGVVMLQYRLNKP